jgi:hypothetical protein
LLDATVNLTHGTSPSVARLSLVPQATLPSEFGTLTLSFGSVSLELPGCRLDYGSVQRTTTGEISQVSILDRRWRWRFGQISGTYNIRRDDASLEQGQAGAISSERTPQQLATLCLEAMAESQFDVSDLPNDARPTVEWDREVPAQALAALCDQLGTQVVLQLDNRVALRRVGQGAELPPIDALQRSSSSAVQHATRSTFRWKPSAW